MSLPVTIVDGMYGRRAVLVSGWSHNLIDYLADQGVVELELNQAKGWKGQDLSFLTALSHILSFDVLDLRIRDISPIHSLKNLKHLGITTYCSTAINFGAFTTLESCNLEWRAASESLFECSPLIKLFLNGYSGSDVAPFVKLHRLQSLAIMNAPFVSLTGLNRLASLRTLRLGGLKRLASLAGIEGLAALEELEVHTCRRIRSIGEVAYLPRLRRLNISNDGDIESLDPLKGLKFLESVVFYESTNIIDGNLAPLLKQPPLSRVSFQNRMHYSHRREDFGSAYQGTS